MLLSTNTIYVDFAIQETSLAIIVEDICSGGRNWQLFNIKQVQDSLKVCNETTRWNLIIKQIKAVFSHSHLHMSSRFSSKTPLDLSARGEHLQKQSLKMFFQDFGHVVQISEKQEGRETGTSDMVYMCRTG